MASQGTIQSHQPDHGKDEDHVRNLHFDRLERSEAWIAALAVPWVNEPLPLGYFGVQLDDFWVLGSRVSAECFAREVKI